jgi:hypothetical protein
VCSPAVRCGWRGRKGSDSLYLYPKGDGMHITFLKLDRSVIASIHDMLEYGCIRWACWEVDIFWRYNQEDFLIAGYGL